jgi:Cu(I)/Ag(I) efflux system membrane fusion protein
LIKETMMNTRKTAIVASAVIGAVAVISIGLAFYFTNAGQGGASDSTAARSEIAAGMTRVRAGTLEIGVATDPAVPRVGENRLILELRDGAGNPLSAQVSAVARMPAMGAMPEMQAPADLNETAPGRFEGSMNLSMRGEWPLTIEIEDPQSGQEERLTFDLATDRAGLSISSGGTPIGDDTAGAGNEAAPDDGVVITIDNRRRQMIGVETGEAALREMTIPVRAVGKIAYDERQWSEVTLRFDAFIGDLYADYVGIPIVAGEPLFTVYSPALLAAQREYLETIERRGAGESSLLRAARQRLRLWDIADAEIEALERRGEPGDYVTIRAPRSGTLIARNVADGSAVGTGETLLTIADLSQVWVEAQVFEADLDLVEAGMSAVVTLPYLPERRYEASVDHIYPYLDAATRTGRLRLTLDNADGALKPDMYAEVSLRASLGERLTVAEEAVIIAGETRVVFVDLGQGRLRPTRIRTGRRAEGRIEVLEGLSAGDRVVTSGNFLLASETRLRTGLTQW